MDDPWALVVDGEQSIGIKEHGRIPFAVQRSIEGMWSGLIDVRSVPTIDFLVDIQTSFSGAGTDRPSDIGRRVREQFRLDFPRTTVSFRGVIVANKEQFFYTVRLVLSLRLAKIAELLCTQGSLAHSLEVAMAAYTHGSAIVTDFPATEDGHMGIDFDYDDGDPTTLRVMMYKAFRLRHVSPWIDEVEPAEERTIHTHMLFSISDPLDERQCGTLLTWDTAVGETGLWPTRRPT